MKNKLSSLLSINFKLINKLITIKAIIFISILFVGLNLIAQETGCVKGDCNSGYGIYKNNYGDIYEGLWMNLKLNGKGKLT